jgi:hypothetical protein
MKQRAPDGEDQALSNSPRFQELIAEARASKADGGLTLEELARELGIAASDQAEIQATDSTGLNGAPTRRPARKGTPGEAVAGR